MAESGEESGEESGRGRESVVEGEGASNSHDMKLPYERMVADIACMSQLLAGLGYCCKASQALAGCLWLLLLSRWFFQQLILAVDYCHRKGVANRDIKLENTLLQVSMGYDGTDVFAILHHELPYSQFSFKVFFCSILNATWLAMGMGSGWQVEVVTPQPKVHT